MAKVKDVSPGYWVSVLRALIIVIIGKFGFASGGTEPLP